MIVFSENFQYDNEVSILQRYPNSHRRGTTLITKAWPLRQGAEPNEEGQTVLTLPISNEAQTVQYVLDFTNDGDDTNQTDNCALNLFGGIDILPNNEGGVVLQINGNTSLRYTIAQTSLRSEPNERQRWHISYSKPSRYLQVVIDGKGVIYTQLTEALTFEPTIAFTSSEPNSQSSFVNNTLTQVVVASNEPFEKILTNINIEAMPLSVSNDGGWTYSDQGLVEDVDKLEGESETPYIESGNDQLVYSVPEIEEDTHVQVYLAGRTTGLTEASVSMFGEGRDLLLPNTQSSLPVVSYYGKGGTLGIGVRGLPPIGGIGIQGELGFGVGVCSNKAWLEELGLAPLLGCDNKESPNYGNYIHVATGSISVFIPKFYYRIGSPESPRFDKYIGNAFDILDSSEFANTTEANSQGYALHRAFIDDGKEKEGFFIDKYVLSRQGSIGVSVKNGQMISLATTSGYVTSSGMPGCTGIFADAIPLMRSRGYGWNCMTLFANNALAMVSLAHGQAARSEETCAWFDPLGNTNFPKGCNNNALGDQDDPTIQYVSSGESGNVNKPLTGSANHFAKTTHNGQDNGVCDVNGVICQMALGITNYGASASATIGIADGSAYIFKPGVKLADVTGGWGDPQDAWQSEANMIRMYDTIDLPWGSSTGWTYFGNGEVQVFSSETEGDSYLQTSAGIPTNEGSSSTGTSMFGNNGNYRDNLENMFASCAGYWNSSLSGVWRRDWNRARSTSLTSRGVRGLAYGS